MIYLVGFSVLVVVLGVVLVVLNGRLWWYDGGVLEFVTILAGSVLLLSAIVWPASFYSYRAEVAKYHAIKATIESSRTEPMDPIERAALTTTIIEINGRLATAKFWNETMFGDLIPDEYAELEFLR